MEQNGNQELTPPSILCRAGCGFYGTESTEGMCSQCYKDALKRKQASPNSPVPSGRDSPDSAGSRSGVASPALSAVTASLATASLGLGYEEKSVETGTTTMSVPHGSATSSLTTPVQESQGQDDSLCSNSSGGAGDEEEGDDKKKPKKTRCKMCKKKVGLTGFTCRCGGVFCGLHRYSDKHECEFDYREMAQNEIRKNNPVIVGEKVQKI